MKHCSSCQQDKPLSEFYPQANGNGWQSKCRRCHNAACAARRRADPTYRARQYQAKQRWNQRNPAKVQIHLRRCLGRLIWDPRLPGVPEICREVESALWQLREAIAA